MAKQRITRRQKSISRVLREKRAHIVNKVSFRKKKRRGERIMNAEL